MTPEAISDDDALVTELFETRKDQWELCDDAALCYILYAHEGQGYKITATVERDSDHWGDFWTPGDIVSVEEFHREVT